MTTQAEFFEANAVDGQLTPAQMMEMLNLPEGESDPVSQGDSPVTESSASEEKAADTNKPNTEQTAPETDPANAVVLAKDGVHTIPYERLVAAREEAKQSKAAFEAAQAELAQAKQQLEEARAQAQARADAGQAPTTQDKQLAAVEKALDAGVDPAIFGDFSEEAIAQGVATLVAQRVEQEVSKRLAPIAEREAKSAEELHFQTIRSAHPDADSIAESAELQAFIQKQPTFVRNSYLQVLQQGTAQQVIELFDAFKAVTKTTQPAEQTNVRDAALKAVKDAERTAPRSLSEIPGSVQANSDPVEAMRTMAATGDSNLLDQFMGKTPAQIDALMRKLL